MPQLMPLNWMFSLFVIGILFFICYYLYSFKFKMLLVKLNKITNKFMYMWLW